MVSFGSNAVIPPICFSQAATEGQLQALQKDTVLSGYAVSGGPMAVHFYHRKSGHKKLDVHRVH